MLPSLGHFLPLLGLLSFAATTALAAFGLTESGNSYVVDTNAGLVFTVDKTNGDITSLKFNGKEAQGSGKHSQIASGIGASCSWTRGGHDNNYIVIPCSASGITHYYVAQYNSPAVHMGTYTTSEPSVGELRYIARLNVDVLPGGPAAANIRGGSAIEGSDVYSVSGQTRSKFYSSVRFINDQVHGVTGSGIGAFMIIPGTGYEGSSGGPFFRDINVQTGDQNELYWYMNSGHTQTESNRMGFHGPYALWFTTGGTPSTFDYSFWEGLPNISGYVPTSQRGRIVGKAIGIPSSFNSKIVVGWSNSNAQYWAKADSSSQDFSSPYMKTGTYTMSLYKGELVVGTQSVTVSAGATSSSNIRSSEPTPSTIFQIGDYDGTPTGFLNADKFETMHPSDSRMSKWGPVTFTVGSSSVGSWPMAQFKDVNQGNVIQVSLSSSQIGARTLEIATTLAFAGGRPTVSIGSWTSSTPAVPNQPDSRGVTRGTYRGNNILYTYNIPSGTLVAGTNKITINVASGSGGSQFLSPNIVFDMIRLY